MVALRRVIIAHFCAYVGVHSTQNHQGKQNRMLRFHLFTFIYANNLIVLILEDMFYDYVCSVLH